MALAFPLSTADFADTLDVSAGNFRLSESRRMSISARGEVITTGGGFRRWEGSVSLTPLKNARAGGFDTLLSVLTENGASILIYDHRRPFPAYDPVGAFLGAATVTITSVNVNMKEMVLSGLPSGYALTRGDYFSFTYLDGAGQTQWSLHRVVDLLVNASAGGVTPTFEVRPHLPEDVTLVGVAVTLKKPVCKAVLRPGNTSFSQGEPGTMSSGQTFDFVQSRR